jgi:predicted nucleotidyltransferase
LLNPDFKDILSEFLERKVDFLLVGAYAMAAHGFPRSTGDIDLFVRATPKNAQNVYAGIVAFGAPLHDLTIENLSTPGIVFQIGVAPIRIDILTKIDGVTFESAWNTRLMVGWDGLLVPVIGLPELIANKRAAGRTKDIADAEQLEQLNDERR